jgi:polygalacturonase
VINNIRDFGASLTGDNHSAFAKAIAAAGSRETVLVPDGEWPVGPVRDNSYNGDIYISLKSNLTLQFEHGAIIKALPSSSAKYAILALRGISNVRIVGQGAILGDRDGHTGHPVGGSLGEWGSGIHLNPATNVTMSDVVVANCWGDGVLIEDAGNGSVSMHGMAISRCRRNGLSVTGVNALSVSGCAFSNIFGTAPNCGIDLETDRPDETIEGVIISGNRFDSTVGANVAIGSPNGTYRNLVVRNNIHDFKSQPIWVSGKATPPGLGIPWWAYLGHLFTKGWSGYPTSWVKP